MITPRRPFLTCTKMTAVGGVSREYVFGCQTIHGYSRWIPTSRSAADFRRHSARFYIPRPIRPKSLRMRSKLLSDFHHRDIYLRAGIVFPLDRKPDRSYAAIYDVPGFRREWDQCCSQTSQSPGRSGGGVNWRRNTFSYLSRSRIRQRPHAVRQILTITARAAMRPGE